MIMSARPSPPNTPPQSHSEDEKVHTATVAGKFNTTTFLFEDPKESEKPNENETSSKPTDKPANTAEFIFTDSESEAAKKRESHADARALSLPLPQQQSNLHVNIDECTIVAHSLADRLVRAHIRAGVGIPAAKVAPVWAGAFYRWLTEDTPQTTLLDRTLALNIALGDAHAIVHRCRQAFTRTDVDNLHRLYAKRISDVITLPNASHPAVQKAFTWATRIIQCVYALPHCPEYPKQQEQDTFRVILSSMCDAFEHENAELVVPRSEAVWESVVGQREDVMLVWGHKNPDAAPTNTVLDLEGVRSGFASGMKMFAFEEPPVAEDNAPPPSAPLSNRLQVRRSTPPPPKTNFFGPL